MPSETVVKCVPKTAKRQQMLLLWLLSWGIAANDHPLCKGRTPQGRTPKSRRPPAHASQHTCPADGPAQGGGASRDARGFESSVKKAAVQRKEGRGMGGRTSGSRRHNRRFATAANGDRAESPVVHAVPPWTKKEWARFGARRRHQRSLPQSHDAHACKGQEPAFPALIPSDSEGLKAHA